MKTKKWLHDKIGWGFPQSRTGGDFYQPTYSCRFCDKELAQDSNLDWFHLSDKTKAPCGVIGASAILACNELPLAGWLLDSTKETFKNFAVHFVDMGNLFFTRFAFWIIMCSVHATSAARYAFTISAKSLINFLVNLSAAQSTFIHFIFKDRSTRSTSIISNWLFQNFKNVVFGFKQTRQEWMKILKTKTLDTIFINPHAENLTSCGVINFKRQQVLRKFRLWKSILLVNVIFQW